MKFSIEARLYLLLRIIVGIIFIWASWSKIYDPEGFARIVQNYRILPSIFVHPFALILPWVEMLCGIVLITGYLVKGSAMIINTLLIIFMLSFIINMFRGIDISCGCFSVSMEATTETYKYLIRELPLLIAGIWILYYRIKREKISSLTAI